MLYTVNVLCTVFSAVHSLQCCTQFTLLFNVYSAVHCHWFTALYTVYSVEYGLYCFILFTVLYRVILLYTIYSLFQI